MVSKHQKQKAVTLTKRHLATTLDLQQSGTKFGIQSSAAIYSIIQTALENELKPLEYLSYIFTQIQHNENISVHQLLPWAEEIPAHCKLLEK